MVFGDPPETDLDIVSNDPRFESVFYSNCILTFTGIEDDVIDLLENRIVDWKVIASGEFYPA